MPSSTQTAEWPQGVIALYLTAGGASVALTHGNRTYPTPDGIGQNRNHTLAVCTGCATAEEFSHWRVVRGAYSTWDTRDSDAADQDARAWAQTHAERCRAMPRPTA
ncbi:hypothetical protein ACWERY_02200 [Streptomyces sp. NPDC004082]